VCAQHSVVVSSEPLDNGDERLSGLRFLQAKAHGLEAEISERKRVQRELEAREAELSDFLQSAAVGIHWVDANGMILWANTAELSMLGYQPQEYIGHHIGEFYFDAVVLEDILGRLSRNEELRGIEVQMKAKDGFLRSVRLHSNAFFKDGHFVHTRC